MAFEDLPSYAKILSIIGGIVFVGLIIFLIYSSNKAGKKNLESFAGKNGFTITQDDKTHEEMKEIINGTVFFSKYGFPGNPYVVGENEAVFELRKSHSNSPKCMTLYWTKTNTPDVVILEKFFEKSEIDIPGLEKFTVSAKDVEAAKQTVDKIKDFLNNHQNEYEVEIADGNLIVAMDGKAYTAEMYDALLEAGREVRDKLK